MKRLVCEVCGSNDMLKQDSMFVCQACGCKYTLDEVRKMMVEGTVEVTGTVKVDNTASVANYLDMARSSMAAKNNSEAEEYCKEILKMDTSVWEAWFIRGTAVGWQSTLRENRLSEMANYYKRALKECPAKEYDKLKYDCEKNIRLVSVAIIELRLDTFRNNPAYFDSEGLNNDLNQIKTYTNSFLKEIKTFQNDTDEALPYAKLIIAYLDQIWDTAYEDYKSVNNGHPLRNDVENFLSASNALYNSAILVIDLFNNQYDNEEANELMISTLKKMNKWNKVTMNVEGWRIDSGSYCGYSKATSMSDEAREERYGHIEKVIKLIEEIQEKGPKCVTARKEKENAEKEERVRAYWEKHIDEKARLENERETVNELIKALKAKMDALPEAVAKRKIEEEAAAVNQLYESLGVFKLKEKKAAKDKIKQLEDQWVQADIAFSNVSASMKKECDKYEDRIKVIEEELTRDRPVN